MVPRALLLLALASVVVGIAANAHAQTGSTELKANPYDVIFSGVAVGDSATKGVVMTNPGTGEITVSKIVEYGPHPTDFTIDTDMCTGVTVKPSGACGFNVVFAPTQKGTRVAHLRVDSTANCSTFITLAGSGPAEVSPVRRAACTAATPTATPTPSPSPTASAEPTATATPEVAGFVGSGSSSACPGRTRVRINFHTNVRERLRLKTAKVTVGGRTFKVKRNKNRLRRVRGYYYSVLQFKGLTRPRYKVRVRGKLTNGKSFARNRLFKNCISSG